MKSRHSGNAGGACGAGSSGTTSETLPRGSRGGAVGLESSDNSIALAGDGASLRAYACDVQDAAAVRASVASAALRTIDASTTEEVDTPP